MEKLKKSRAPVRSAITRLYTELTTAVAATTPSKTLLLQIIGKLEEKVLEVTEIDKQILSGLLDIPSTTDDAYETEANLVDEYKHKLVDGRVLVDVALNSLYSHSRPPQNAVLDDGKRKFRLPQLELTKFGGELREWLGFWSVFAKIHDDDAIEDADKFQYLLQAIKLSSRAREMVESYPPTAENYVKVIESLKKRFGRDELLVEVYVRELLKLVLHNALHPKEKIELTTLFDQIECHMRALDTLGVTSDKCASMLYPLVESCLPEEVLRVWQRTPSTGGHPSLSQNRLTTLMDFLRLEVEGEERIKLARTGFGINAAATTKTSKKKEIPDEVSTAAGLLTNSSQSNQPKALTCVFCEKNHSSHDCFTAKKMKMADKRLCLQKKRACFSCLKVGHSSKICKTNLQCIVCARKHVTLMCPEISTNKEFTPKEKEKEVDPATKSNVLASLTCSTGVALQTLVVKIREQGRERIARAIIDTASQRSYILRNTAAEVGLQPKGSEKMIHMLFGGIKSQETTHSRYAVTLSNLDNENVCTVELLDQSKICENLPRIPKGNWFDELRKKGIWLSDVGVDSSEIEILLGADVAGGLLTGNVKQLQSGLTAVQTKLGWTLLGKIPGSQTSGNTTLLVSSLLTCESTLSDLWKLESIGITDSGESKTRAIMEQAAQEHFLKTVKINKEGRYEVNLPWIEGHPQVPSNRIIAEKRLESCTKKLVTSGRIDDYQAVFDDWLMEGIIEKVQEEKFPLGHHFLPHRAVIKENSSTTKVRPVFDASSKQKNSPSLNDCLETGPNLIELIPSTIMRFRLKRIGVVSDITKAFLQICVSPKDCNFLLFLWWEDATRKKIITYRHRRVPFGATSSPFLLASVLRFHMQQAPPKLQATASLLTQSFYVDNCVTSVDDERQLFTFIHEAQELMSMGKFELRGWEHSALKSDIALHEVEETSLLGIRWNKKEDVLSYDLRWIGDCLDGPVTKRKILSVAHTIFDPIGVTCPATLFPKTILQETWKLKLGWDCVLPEDISSKFLQWSKDLVLLTEVRIPRWLNCAVRKEENWSLHTFTDASKMAYAACVFIRVETKEGVYIQLVQAKSRVAPLEKLSIPRLELMSCLIGCRLTESVKKSLSLEDISTFYWNDSSTALCWIQKDDPWATFVGNRVKEIRTLSKISDWRHVPGDLNPADLPSRGCKISQLIQSKWWEGPRWLKLSPDEWPKSSVQWNEVEVNKERKKTVSSLIVGNREIPWYAQKFSKYHKILRVIAWILRFRALTSINTTPEKGPLQVHELEAAEKKLLGIVQCESFPSEPDKIHKSLAVFRDIDGILRVKTKLLMREDKHSFKLPILLPANHFIVHSLIREVHLQNCHCGVQTLLSILREKYWIVRGRKTIRSVLMSCIRCKRHEVKGLCPLPGTLPQDRVQTADIFEVTGVDLAGPLYLKGGQKSWIVLYTCAVYRAVHFELVTSLSTEAFLQSLRRFISRRGRPSIIYSDNGTNFVGAENLFKEINWSVIETFSTERRIQWKFNPPSAAWWGGWWERIVRMVKNLLRRVLGRTTLSYEDLNTLLCDTESVINARPLTYLSEDIDDLAPLSPSVFMHDRRDVGVPDIDQVDRTSLNKKFRHRQELLDQLRKRFRIEYLGQLVQKAGTKEESRTIKIGDVVLVGSDNQKRLDWPLGKILEIYPGKDGQRRVVRLKTARGELVRPVQRIFPLEVNSAENPFIDVEEKNQDDLLGSKDKNEPVIVHHTPKPTSENPVKVFRTRSGRQVKVPLKYIATYSSFL